MLNAGREAAHTITTCVGVGRNFQYILATLNRHLNSQAIIPTDPTLPAITDFFYSKN
jgi:hypothetical protein